MTSGIAQFGPPQFLEVFSTDSGGPGLDQNVYLWSPIAGRPAK
jgi:hypothetical protein